MTARGDIFELAASRDSLALNNLPPLTQPLTLASHICTDMTSRIEIVLR